LALKDQAMFQLCNSMRWGHAMDSNPFFLLLVTKTPVINRALGTW